MQTRDERTVFILRSRSSPEFYWLSPSSITIQKKFKHKVQVQMKSKKSKNAAFAQKKCRISFPFTQSKSGPGPIFWCDSQPGFNPNSTKFAIVRIQFNPSPVQCSSLVQTRGVQLYRSRSVGVDSAGVLTNFENRSGAGVYFFKEMPERIRSNFMNIRLVCSLLIIIIAGCFFTKHVIM